MNIKRQLMGLLIITSAFSWSSTYAAVWYVDKKALGSNNGKTWENAWRSFFSISWDLLGAGDTIYISGGSDMKIYRETLRIGKEGSPGMNIVIQTGQEAGHNGTVIIDAEKKRKHSILLRDYVTISGKVGSKRRMVVRNSLDTGIKSRNADGNVITYVEVTACGASEGKFPHGIHLNRAGNGCEVSYCYIHHNYKDGYNASGSRGGAFGQTKLHHNIIVFNSDDGIACRSGHDIYENIIGEMWQQPGGGSGHPDGIQAQGEYTRIWSNEIYNCRTHGIFADPLRIDSASHIYIFNNLVYRTQSFASAGHHMAGMSVKAERGTNTINDVIVANNTVADVGYKGLTVSAPNNRNVRILNNLFYNCRMDGRSGHVLGTLKGTSGVVIDYNLLNSGRSGGTVMVWGRKNMTHYKFRAYGYGQKHGQTRKPRFVSYKELRAGNNFHLAASDRACRKNGLNLSEYFIKDKDGKKRIDWDIGCYAFKN